MSRIYSSILLAICLLFPLQSHANIFGSVKKWVKSEAIPTIKGERPLNIKPYVTITSDENHIKFHVDTKDNFQLRIGDVNMSTHQFSKRLAQAGCIVATEGDVVDCAPDILARELVNVADGIDTNNPGSASPDQRPQYSVPVPASSFHVLPPGYGMQMCGCWGFNPPPVAYEPRCMSNRVMIGVCPGMCPAGGSPYGYMCM